MKKQKNNGLNPYVYPEWVLSSNTVKQININKHYKIFVSFLETTRTPLADIRLWIDDIPRTTGFFLTHRSVLELMSVLESFLEMYPIKHKTNN